MEYKYVVLDQQGGVVRWQEGANNTLCLRSAGFLVHVTDSWAHESRQVHEIGVPVPSQQQQRRRAAGGSSGSKTPAAASPVLLQNNIACFTPSSSSSSSVSAGRAAQDDAETQAGDALLVASNEVGFSAADVAALCDMSASTKSRAAGAFTGEKGAALASRPLH